MCTLELSGCLFWFREGEIKDVALGFVGLKESAECAEAGQSELEWRGPRPGPDPEVRAALQSSAELCV